TQASSNWNDADSRVGKNYKFRPYFKDAVEKGEGRYYAIGATGHIPGYYLAGRVETPAGSRGVAVVKVDLSPLQGAWKDAGEKVGLVDNAGTIFLSSEPEWQYSPLYPLSPDELEDRRERYGADLPDKSPLQLDRDVKPGQTFYLTFQGRKM